MSYYVCIKNPKPFQEDYVFKVPDCLVNGYVNLELGHALKWYEQVYPEKEVNNDQTNKNPRWNARDVW